MTEDNFRAVCELAGKDGIKAILGLLLPVSDYAPSKQTTRRPLADTLRLNDWLRNYATEIHAPVADYYSALVDDHGMLREGYSDDGLHPNERGYAVMHPSPRRPSKKRSKSEPGSQVSGVLCHMIIAHPKERSTRNPSRKELTIPLNVCKI